jgi:hypothetical protein
MEAAKTCDRDLLPIAAEKVRTPFSREGAVLLTNVERRPSISASFELKLQGVAILRVTMTFVVRKVNVSSLLRRWTPASLQVEILEGVHSS